MNNKIGIAGDWHGNLQWGLTALNVFADAKITDIYHLGDFGVWEHDRKYETALNDLLATNGQTLWVTLGNHENYAIVKNFTQHPHHTHVTYSPQHENILYFKRGARFHIGGRSFVSLGGANSIDRFLRTPHSSWWEEEQITLGDAYRTIEGGYADVFLAHDCPAGVPLPLLPNPEKYWGTDGVRYAQGSREMLRQVIDVVQPKRYFFGHYHFPYDGAHTLTALDGGGDYETRYVCLDKEYSETNLAVYDTVEDTMEHVKP